MRKIEVNSYYKLKSQSNWYKYDTQWSYICCTDLECLGKAVSTNTPLTLSLPVWRGMQFIEPDWESAETRLLIVFKRSNILSLIKIPLPKLVNLRFEPSIHSHQDYWKWESRALWKKKMVLTVKIKEWQWSVRLVVNVNEKTDRYLLWRLTCGRASEIWQVLVLPT